MNKNLLNLFCLTAITALTASCSADLEGSDFDEDAVTFKTTMMTRASGTTWSVADRIGVYMKPAGSDISASTSSNTAYVTASGDGFFLPEQQGAHYPQDGSKVDFVAYYPYSSTLTGTQIAVNLSDQSKPESIDLMYADNLKELDRTSKQPVLAFSHKLAKVELTLKSSDGASLDGMSATLGGQPASGTFDLANGTFSSVGATADMAMNFSANGTAATASAFSVPTFTLATSELKPLTVTLTSKDGKKVTVTLAKDIRTEGGKVYQYTLNVKNSGGSQETAKYARYFETPTITAEQLQKYQYVTHTFKDGSRTVRNYSILYDKEKKYSYWVAYPLCNYYTKKNSDRTDAWGYDPQVSTSDQARLDKGYGGRGYDRGHQIPSADRLVNNEANVQTFYFTNMTPQVGQGLNQTVWAKLEDQVRSWSSNIDTLYVVTGAMPPTSGTAQTVTDNDRQPCEVPGYYFKALCKVSRSTGEAFTIAFKFDNKSYSSNEDYMSHTLTVAELEQLTGFTFFPSIDSKYKQTIDSSKW